MHRTISLSAYVKRRNGVALGASGSMSNMLKRSLGAGSFYLFWQYWNPIWGYYLSRNVMKPLRQLVPVWLATIMTFTISGGLHDLAVGLLRWEFSFFITPWFVLMSIVVLVSKKFNISYYKYHWLIRTCLNVISVAACLGLVIMFKHMYF